MTSSPRPHYYFNYINAARERLSGLQSYSGNGPITQEEYDICQRNFLKIWTLIIQGNSEKSEDISIELEPLIDKLVLQAYTEEAKREKSQECLRNLKDINSILEHNHLELAPSLVGMHVRSPNVTKGRMSATRDTRLTISGISSWDLHEKLLEVYFQIYGRSRTFNEFVFNRLNDKKDIDTAKVTICFAESSDEESSFLKIDTQINKKPTGKGTIEDTLIQLSKELQDLLLPNDILTKFFGIIDEISNSQEEYNTEHKNILGQWHARLSSFSEAEPTVITTLAEYAERAYCCYTSRSCNKTVETWGKLMEFMNPKVGNISFWNRDTRDTAKGIIKALQGICLYRYFAAGSITTIAKERKSDERSMSSASAITLGFDKPSERKSQGILQSLERHFFGPEFSLFINGAPKKTDDSRNCQYRDEEIWQRIKATELYKHDQALLRTLISVYRRFQSLCYAVHEGFRLEFTAYVGDQISLSKFRCLHFFTKEDAENLDKYNEEVIRSHYSLFLDGKTGLFFDKTLKDNIALVRPLSFRQKAKEQLFNLEEDALAQQDLKQQEFLISFSGENEGLAIMTIRSEEVFFYYKGSCILENSRRTNFKLDLLETNEYQPINWGHESIVSLLKDKILRSLTEPVKKYVPSTAATLATAICRVSETPGYGGMIIFVGEPMLETMKTSLNLLQLSYWNSTTLYSCSADLLVSMIIPDGSCVIQTNTLIIQNQSYIVPIGENGRLVDKDAEAGKGTRHRTAQAITDKEICVKEKVDEIWAICISADGGISVYSDGKKITPSQLESYQSIIDTN